MIEVDGDNVNTQPLPKVPTTDKGHSANDWADDASYTNPTNSTKGEGIPDNIWDDEIDINQKEKGVQFDTISQASYDSNETIILSDDSTNCNSLPDNTYESIQNLEEEKVKLENSEAVTRYKEFAAKILARHDPPHVEGLPADIDFSPTRRPYYSNPKHIQPFPTIAPSEKDSFDFGSWLFTNLIWALVTYVMYRIRKEQMKYEEAQEKSKKDKNDKK